jgi:arylformamidase
MQDISKRSYIDISPVIHEKLGVFPGDVEFSRAVTLDFKQGHNLLLSSIRTTLHLGAHADAPNHYDADGRGIAERDLTPYFGECLVVRAKVARSVRVGLSHFNADVQTRAAWPERVLVYTGSFPDPDNWNSDFCSFEPEFLEFLALKGVRLVGIDTPSVDPESSKKLEAHQILKKHNMSVLEGLVLNHVNEGIYQLIALPLAIKGADASPVRAILLR